MRSRLLMAVRSILLGWAALFAITRFIVRPLLHWTGSLLGASWLPTAELGLSCAGLAATGWIIGRWNPLDAIRLALLFSVMLAVWDFGLVPDANVRWLFRLTIDVFGSARYIESLITAWSTHALLFGSLIAGARLTRPRQNEPISLAR